MKLITRFALAAAIAVPVLAACTKQGGEETVAVTGVTLDKQTVTLTAGQTVTETLTATVNPSNATNKNLTWSVGDSGIATITANGASCTVAAVAAGTTTVTVTTADGNKTATCDVTVKSGSVEPTFVTMDPESATISVAGNVTLIATVFPTEATDKSVTWSTSDETVATVDQTGKVTGVAPGTADITATTNVGGKVGICSVKVAGMAKLTLEESWFSTNAAMTYVSMNKVGDPVVETDQTDTDKYGFGTPDWINPLDEVKGANRLAELGTISNMWDNNIETCYHTNIDWGTVSTTWGNRDDVDFGQHYLKMVFPSNYTKVRIVLTANAIHTEYMNASGEMVESWNGPRRFGTKNSETEEIEGGFVLYWSADGEEFVKYDNGGDIVEGKVECPDYGSVADVTLEATEAVPAIAAIKIESQQVNDWTKCESAFGIAELEVYAE